MFVGYTYLLGTEVAVVTTKFNVSPPPGLTIPASSQATFAGGGGGDVTIHVVSAPKAWDQRARLWGFQFVVRTLKGLGPGPYFGEAR